LDIITDRDDEPFTGLFNTFFNLHFSKFSRVENKIFEEMLIMERRKGQRVGLQPTSEAPNLQQHFY